MNDDNTSWQRSIEALWDRFGKLSPDAFLSEMSALAAVRPAGDPMALFELASAHDALDREQEAAILYRRALSGELPENVRRQAVIQLASTLRNLGELEESVGLLKAEVGRSDELDDAVLAFLCLSLIDAGRPREAAARALAALATHLPRYRKSVTTYANAILSDDLD
ncbi:MAG: hypothetical protein JWP26_1270 [Devosia sp.]|uniref:tetratricopeptide repeat protein n=1 Tax=Devosia sp. TaxID=1871048 RepID=UPI00262925E5|nr:tetratricopeptide repeat protein [Devosia sp.]MDB5586300.1 hypothetical protein [Devosia sp.]